ncbi:NAD(P)-dependent oxidoreductase [Pseudonocardia sp. N23]|uniref:NAD(P)-dependent oxidoreductase n=1 Tax=Pseudonocardia sp. N23 TaxID=1987376 RepID=UPI000C038085|nr:NAD(P)-dependent oxidoreductase [Pseudonocardia sp. N23]GAY11499.1 2-hydroxy-3-oxopropionate reductase [Pseudonocardia sp. N23]
MTGPALPSVVGFVGLGRMGDPMARHVAAGGVAVRAFDADPAALRRLDGVVTSVGSVAEAAEGMPVVILMLPDSDVVDAVVGDGLLDALEPGAVLVDMSSSEPLRTRELAGRVADAGAELVDAPVSGGVRGAEAATLAIMVGGDEVTARRLGPLLASMGRPRRVGDVGAGHALKALNNLMSAANLLAASEALLAGQRFGLDPAVMLEVVNGASGRSNGTETKWPDHVLPGTFGSGFTAGLMAKDVRIALGLIEATGIRGGVAGEVVDRWRAAVELLGPAADHTEIVRYLQRTSGE